MSQKESQLLQTPFKSEPEISASGKGQCDGSSSEEPNYEHEPAISVQDVFSKPVGVRFGLEFFRKLNGVSVAS